MHNYKNGGAASFDFNLEPDDETALALTCTRLQTSSESSFLQNAVLQRHSQKCIWMMRGRVLRKVTPDSFEDYLVKSAAEYVGVLAEIFALDLPKAASLWPKICTHHEALLAERERAPTEIKRPLCRP